MGSQRRQLQRDQTSSVSRVVPPSASARLSGKAIVDISMQTALEGTSQLLNSITRLIQTAIGTGAFLCLLGTIVCAISFWMLTLVPTP